MSSSIVIAIDAMGGDHGPEATIPGAALALVEAPDARFIFVGDGPRITALAAREPSLAGRYEIVHTNQVIGNNEKPSSALRNGRQSSLRLAIDAVGDGKAGGIVSAGNTGALMATAKMVLKTLPGIKRPAIASVLPSMRGPVVMLDLGANIECDAEVLVQFALLGAVFARVVRGYENPSVGLLNVGSEEMKGHEELREASSVLSQVQFPGRYFGFVEGNDIPLGTVDVVVTDGFTGNIALKVAEGVGKLAGSYVKEAFMTSWTTKLAGVLASVSLNKVKRRMDPRYYNGGMFLGLGGICVKSHGSMDKIGFAQAIVLAANLVERDYNSRVALEVQQLVNQAAFSSRPCPWRTGLER